MSRIHNFSDFVGHDWLKNYLQSKISKGTLPHFLIIDGQEGLGKTSVADLIAVTLVYGDNPSDEILSHVIDNRHSTDAIKKFVMSVEGGKEMAKTVLAEIKTNIMVSTKVLILDECHAMSDAAQDVFLSELEYLPKNVYVIMLTTELGKLKPTLKSRAVPIHLDPLKLSDTMTILKREVMERNLEVQGGDATLRLIAEWSENKPRTALSVLSAFNNESVSTDTIKALIGYMDTESVIQLLQMLSGPVIYGIDYISSMQVSESLIPIVTEFIKVKSGMHSYKLKFSDARNANSLLSNVSMEQLTTFLYGITSHERLTRKVILNSFLRAHKGYEEVLKEDKKVLLEAERNIRSDNTEITNANTMTAPTLDSLLITGKIVT